MKILVRNSDKRVMYAGNDLTLGEYLRGIDWADSSYNTGNAAIANATLPANWTGGIWSYNGSSWTVADTAGHAAHLAKIAAAEQTARADDREALIKKIDADIDAIYREVQGDRTTEYLRAESEAAAFKLAGYVGPVPESVQSWANATGWTPTQATDDILVAAAGWRSAQSAMRATRLTCKAIARTADDLTAVTAQWAVFLVTIKTALGVL